MNKTKIERLVLFNLNLDYSFTELGFIQKKTKQIISRKDAGGGIFCQNLNYKTKNSLRD